MLLTLGHKPLDIPTNSEYWYFNEAHEALSVLFTPSPAIIGASLIAYSCSQLTDIYVFSKLKQLTRNNHLWIRTFLSVSLAALIDSALFNLFAWKVFSSLDISWSTLFFTYFRGAYIVQLAVAILNIPVLYVLLKFVRK
jgi:uncharacterized integral membrane protein (TIGR00697 family)